VEATASSHGRVADGFPLVALLHQSQLLMGYLSLVWIPIEQSVMVSGIVYVIMGFAVHDQLRLLIMGHWQLWVV